jgi:hypothetical protein
VCVVNAKQAAINGVKLLAIRKARSGSQKAPGGLPRNKFICFLLPWRETAQQKPIYLGLGSTAIGTATHCSLRAHMSMLEF